MMAASPVHRRPSFVSSVLRIFDLSLSEMLWSRRSVFLALLVGGPVLLAVVTLRGDVPEAEGGEDVDLSARPDWATVAQLVAIFALNIALVDFLGWAITGALLFAGVARVLGSRTPIRDLIIGAVMSVGSFYAFYVALGVPIPPGILDGIL